MSQAIIDLGFTHQPIHMKLIQEECDRIVRGLYNQSLQDIKLADLLHDVLAVPRDNHLQLPSSVGAMAKAVANVEGVARTLNPNLPTIELARPLVEEAVRKRFMSKDALQSAAYASLYNLQSWSAIPGRLETLIDQMQDSEFGIQWYWPEQQAFQRVVSRGIKRLALAVISVGCLLSGSQLIAFNAKAANNIFGLHLIWGNVLLSLGVGIAAWLILLLMKEQR